MTKFIYLILDFSWNKAPEYQFISYNETRIWKCSFDRRCIRNDLLYLFGAESFEKIPSEMEVARHYTVFTIHCLHC